MTHIGLGGREIKRDGDACRSGTEQQEGSGPRGGHVRKERWAGPHLFLQSSSQIAYLELGL